MSGTQSPPLEFTGEEKTLGASATNKPEGVANVKMDAEQRGGEWNFPLNACLLQPPQGGINEVIRIFGYRTDSVGSCSLLWWQDRRDEAEQCW